MAVVLAQPSTTQTITIIQSRIKRHENINKNFKPDPSCSTYHPSQRTAVFYLGWPEAATDASWFRELIWSAVHTTLVHTTRFLLHHLLFTLGLAGLLLGGSFGRMIAALFSQPGLRGTQCESHNQELFYFSRPCETQGDRRLVGGGGTISLFCSITCITAVRCSTKFST